MKYQLLTFGFAFWAAWGVAVADVATPTCNLFEVQAIPSDFEIKLRPLKGECQSAVPEATWLVLLSADTQAPLGYAQGMRWQAGDLVARVRVHSNEGLVRVGGQARVMDLSQKVDGYWARTDLMANTVPGASSRYKPLVYGGISFGQMAAVLQPREKLLGLGLAGYGLNQFLQLDSIPIYDWIGYPNLALKLKFLDTDDMRTAFSGRGYFAVGPQAFFGDLEVYLDTFSNSKMTSYSRMSLKSRRPQDTPLSADVLENAITPEFQFAYGVMLSNWDRILLGPRYNAQAKVLGGTLVYNFVYDHFEWVLGLSANDFLKLRYGANGYQFTADFWWRIP